MVGYYILQYRRYTIPIGVLVIILIGIIYWNKSRA